MDRTSCCPKMYVFKKWTKRILVNFVSTNNQKMRNLHSFGAHRPAQKKTTAKPPFELCTLIKPKNTIFGKIKKRSNFNFFHPRPLDFMKICSFSHFFLFLRMTCYIFLPAPREWCGVAVRIPQPGLSHRQTYNTKLKF